MAVRIAIGVCFFASCLSAADLASRSIYEGRPIAAVRFDPANQPLAEQDLQRLVPFKPGSPLHLSDVRSFIKRLYDTGQFSDVEVDTEPSPAGLILVIRTSQQWFVGPVEVHGKTSLPPNLGQLANATRLDLGTPFSDDEIQTAVNGIRRLLERNGLYRATIEPDVRRDAAHQQVAITFEVNGGRRARLTLPVITGNTRLEADDVAAAAKYKGPLFFPWKLATQENLQGGLQNIHKKYQKQDRLTASVTLTRTDLLKEEYRVRPTINVEGGPKIRILAKEAKVSKGTLQKYVPVYDQETVNRDLLVTGVRNLRDYFQTKGYFDVQVDFNTQDVDPDHQDIVYVISLGERHRVVDVVIQGNRYFSTQVIRERMFTQPKGLLTLRHGRYSQSLAARDVIAIQALYRDSGFRDATVIATTTDDVKGKEGDVAITFSIEEGPQYIVSSLNVTGITRPERQQMLNSLASAAGQPFSETNVALDRDYILRQYQATGYPSATVDSRVAPGPSPHQMAVTFTVKEGMPQIVRDVVISGLRTTRRRLTNPAMELKPGEPLSWTRMGEIQRNLYDLGVFDKVDMAIQNPDGDLQSKYVDYHFTEGHLYNMAIGVGAEIARIGGSQTSLNNPGGATGFAPRFDLELSRLNMWGLGHSVNFKGRYSTLDRRLSLNYLAPRFHNVEGRNISVTALYDNTRDVLTFTAVRLQGALQVSQKLSKATNLLLRYSWTNNRIDAGTLKIDPLLIPLYSQASHIGLLAANLVQDRRDDSADAHRGYFNSLDVGVAEHAFGGNRNFLRFLGRNSYYKTVKTHYVLASNTEFGVIRPFRTGSIDPNNYVPLPERFFGGGGNTLRAFPVNQAGPRDPVTGFPVGGNALFFHQTELRFPFLSDNMQGVLFHDMGNIYSKLSDLSFRVHQKDLEDFNYMAHAAGFGVRYRTPLGPISLDLAYSINPPKFNGLNGTYQQLLFGGATHTVTSVSHFQFFFSIGQAF
jgi:outer membrane protein assembly complex protein YaeT